MTRAFAAAMRRATKLMRPAKRKKATRTIQTVMAGLAVKAMLSAIAKPETKAKTSVKRTKARAKTAGSLGSVVAQLSKVAIGKSASSSIAGRGKGGLAGERTLQSQMLTHRTAAGSRAYRLHLPSDHADTPKGLVLMLHGCNQTPDDFAKGTGMNRHADKHGLVIVYPAQTTAENAAACWNWFRPGNQVRNRGEPALLASLTKKLMKQYGLERNAVFVAGLSAGGAMAAILADVYPDVFSAAGIHSGLARGSASDVLSAMSATPNDATGNDHACL